MLTAPPATGARCAACRLHIFPLTTEEVPEVCGWDNGDKVLFEPHWKVQNFRAKLILQSLLVINVFPVQVLLLYSSSSFMVYFGSFKVDTLWEEKQNP